MSDFPGIRAGKMSIAGLAEKLHPYLTAVDQQWSPENKFNFSFCHKTRKNFFHPRIPVQAGKSRNRGWKETSWVLYLKDRSNLWYSCKTQEIIVVSHSIKEDLKPCSCTTGNLSEFK